MACACGVPWVRLTGTAEDWAAVRRRAAGVCTLCTPEFGIKWAAALLPVLDEFHRAYTGHVNHLCEAAHEFTRRKGAHSPRARV